MQSNVGRVCKDGKRGMTGSPWSGWGVGDGSLTVHSEVLTNEYRFCNHSEQGPGSGRCVSELSPSACCFCRHPLSLARVSSPLSLPHRPWTRKMSPSPSKVTFLGEVSSWGPMLHASPLCPAPSTSQASCSQLPTEEGQGNQGLQ